MRLVSRLTSTSYTMLVGLKLPIGFLIHAPATAPTSMQVETFSELLT